MRTHHIQIALCHGMSYMVRLRGVALAYSPEVNSANTYTYKIDVTVQEFRPGLIYLDLQCKSVLLLAGSLLSGSGFIKQDILSSYDYYVAVGNLNSEDVKVELNLSVRSSMYDTADSYYKCSLNGGWCDIKIPFPGGNAALLTTPGPLEGLESHREYVKLSYEPRWMTYFLGIGGMTSVMLCAFNFLIKIRHDMEDSTENQSGELGSERAPLLSQKDDEHSSLGSSYDSGSQNDEDTQEDLEEGCRRLCVICFDAPKDCFFIPCGHCATCLTCGTSIAEAPGICPICRRKIKKVRRIYTV